jgi:riboflavin kinase/FMN adenylyltransferase
VGNFDGVHLGHQRIIEDVISIARQRNDTSVLITFDPHPVSVIMNMRPEVLTTLDQRRALVTQLGIAKVVVLPFTQKTAQISAEEFLGKLQKNYAMSVLCVGPTTQLGRNREGTPERMKELSDQMGFELWIVPTVEANGGVVSSSRIRELIGDGDVEGAARCLGRRYETEGRVINGVSRGQKLGFPTANLEVVTTLLPKVGVYASLVHVEGRVWKAATNVGWRPTFGDLERPMVESHLLGFSGDLVGRPIRIEWVSRVRAEERFSSVEALRAQIQLDCKMVERMVIKSGNFSIQ